MMSVRTPRFRLLLVVACMVSSMMSGFTTGAADDPGRVVVIAAGVPRNLGETATDDEIFAMLADAGVTAFLPVFQYQEQPEAKSLPRDQEFFPPCAPDAEPFKSMRAHGVQLVIPGELLYGGGNSPEDGDAMLRQLIACAGDGGVFGVYSVDEPAHDLTLLAEHEATARVIYERTKAVAPELPVLMIHAPLITEVLDGDTWRVRTPEEVETELAAIVRMSEWGDITGFDLYVVPAETAKIATPADSQTAVDWSIAIPAYTAWMTDTLPNKAHAIVLQGFGFSDLLGLPEMPEGRQPSMDELTGMACAAISGGATYLAWYGQSFLDASDAKLWGDILDVSREVGNNRSALCV